RLDTEGRDARPDARRRRLAPGLALVRGRSLPRHRRGLGGVVRFQRSAKGPPALGRECPPVHLGGGAQGDAPTPVGPGLTGLPPAPLLAPPSLAESSPLLRGLDGRPSHSA